MKLLAVLVVTFLRSNQPVQQPLDKPAIVLAHPQLAILERALSSRFQVYSWWKSEEPDLIEARTLLVAGEVPLDQRMLDGLPGLEYVACVSTGYDGLDISELRRRGLKVSVARDVNATDVADHAIARILSLYQSLPEANRLMKLGQWDAAAALPNHSLFGAKLGIVGLGSVGQAIANRGSVFEMQIGWWGPQSKPALWPRAGSLTELAQWSDILVVAARAHAGNEKLISSDIINAMGPQARIVNVARGRLVDEDALIDALREYRLAGAALDVFETEPTPSDRWRDIPNVIITPHIAGRTQEALRRIVDQLIENLENFFSGQDLVTEL